MKNTYHVVITQDVIDRATKNRDAGIVNGYRVCQECVMAVAVTDAVKPDLKENELVEWGYPEGTIDYYPFLKIDPKSTESTKRATITIPDEDARGYVDKLVTHFDNCEDVVAGFEFDIEVNWHSL